MQSKGIVIILIVVSVITAVLLAVSLLGIGAQHTAAPVYVSGSAEAATDTVSVYGQGKVALSPDQATITFGYESEDADPAAAQQANESQMEKIISAVKAVGLGGSDLKTASYQVYRRDDTKKFVVYNMMQVNINNIEKTSSVIKAAYEAGANQFWDVQFDIVKRQEAYTDALSLAMDRARAKAEKLAADEGRSVSAVVSIEEGTDNNNYYSSSPYTNYVSSAPSSSGGYTDGGISSGTMDISALVNVTYRLN